MVVVWATNVRRDIPHFHWVTHTTAGKAFRVMGAPSLSRFALLAVVCTTGELAFFQKPDEFLSTSSIHHLSSLDSRVSISINEIGMPTDQILPGKV
jgi:hypothetical protein